MDYKNGSAHDQAMKAMDQVCKSQGGAVREGGSGDPHAGDEINSYSGGSGHDSAPDNGVSGKIPVNESTGSKGY